MITNMTSPVHDPHATTALPGAYSEEAPPSHFPGYILEDEIGRGGMGVVYRARDLEMNREVAVKILQSRFAVDSTTAARFVEEACITGQLQHPGIPAVYRVASLSDGRPFLAMKLIKGETLDILLKTNSSINRLAVFEAIAQAVGYAHANYVIHRDLKPANIMVGAFGEVQVMDWGLAKVLSKAPSAKSQETDPNRTVVPTTIRSLRDTDGSFTQAGSLLGTPAYMSPEQAGGELDKIDTRSDVFGLGALLCVLLTGRPPFSGKEAESVRLNALRGKMDEALAALDACQAEPGVVALCKQCLSFEPADRPKDANAVAAIVAQLRSEAEARAKQAELDKAKAEVFAAEQTKRRRLMQYAGGCVALVLLLGVVGTTFGLFRAEQRRRDAVAQANLANAVKSFLKEDVLLLADPNALKEPDAYDLKYDADLKLTDVVLRAAKTIEGKFPDQPLIEAEIRHTLGSTLHGLGRYDMASKQFERAVELRKVQLGLDDADTLLSMTGLANCYEPLGKQADALKLREETLSLRKQKLGPDHPDTLLSMNNLANSFDAVGRRDEALHLREETLTLRKQKLGPDHPDTLRSMYNLANSYAFFGRKIESLQLREETLALMKQKLGPDHPNTLACTNVLAKSYASVGRLDEGLHLLEESLNAQKKKLGYDHPHTLMSMVNLANWYASLNRPTELMKLREEILLLQKQKLGPEHSDTIQSTYNLAESYASQNRPADAVKLYEEALPLQKKKLGLDDPKTLIAMHNLASCYSVLGRKPEAVKLYEETLELMKKKLGPEHPNTLLTMQKLAECYAALRRHDEAFKLREERLTLLKKIWGFDHPDVQRAEWDIVNPLMRLKQFDEALPYLEDLMIQTKNAVEAGKTVKPKEVSRMIGFRMQILRDKGDLAGCRITTEKYENLGLTDALFLYDAACCRAILSTMQAKGPETDASSLAKAEADKAMVWLAKAVAAGWKDRAHMEKDNDLDALRDREDFKKLVESLPKK